MPTMNGFFFYFFLLDHGATVIQRRSDGSVNFDQIWEKYENGFGDFQGERHFSLLKTLRVITHLMWENSFSTANF